VKQDPLAGLHDIHLPEPVSWWPPAPGWWILLALVLLMIAALLWWWQRRKQQRRKPKQFTQRDMLDQALSELSVLQQQTADGNNILVLVADLSALLRRVSIRLEQGDASIAGLSGEAWLLWLDAQWEKDAFAQGAGRQLLDAPFQRDGQVDIDSLLQISSDWLQAQR